jgi:hypothetical protein
MAQMVVQSTQSVWSVGRQVFPDIARVAKGEDSVLKGFTQDLGLFIAGIINNRAGKELTGESKHLFELMRRTGYLSDLDSVDIGDIVLKPEHWLLRHAASPMRFGEATNRAIAFLVARRAALYRLSQGTLKDVNGRTFRGTIDSDAFINIVLQDAKITALNMGRAGQLGLTRGMKAPLFQFWQVVPKSVNMLTTARVPLSEKLSASATAVGVFGISALPMMGEFFTVGDYVMWKAKGSTFTDPDKLDTGEILPDNRHIATGLLTNAMDWVLDGGKTLGIDESTLKRFEGIVKKGAIHELSDGEIDIISRISMSKWVSEYLDHVDNPAEAVVAVSVLNRAIESGGNIINLLNDIYNEGSKITPGEAMDIAARETGKVFIGLGSMYQAGRTAFGDMVDPSFKKDPAGITLLQDRKGNPVNLEATPGRVLQTAFGLRPGKLIDIQEASQLEFELRDRLREYEDKMVDRYKAAPRAARESIMVEFYDQMVATNAFFGQEGLLGLYTEPTIKSFQNRTIRIENLEVTPETK